MFVDDSSLMVMQDTKEESPKHLLEVLSKKKDLNMLVKSKSKHPKHLGKKSCLFWSMVR